MSTVGPVEDTSVAWRIGGSVDERTREVLHSRTQHDYWRRGWMVRRALLAADLAGLALAFAAAVSLFSSAAGGRVQLGHEWLFFFATLPVWVLLAKLHGLYDGDEESADTTTVDDAVGVFHVVTVGVWLFYLFTMLTGLANPGLGKLAVFWSLALVLVPAARGFARARCRRSLAYLQNTVIVGAGDVGQLIARKLLQHPEYGLNIVGFVDVEPKQRRGDLRHLALLGTPDELPTIMRLFDVDRVVIAFSNQSHEDILELIRSIRDFDVQIDLVPRLFEAIGPKVAIHTVEGLPLVGLPPARPARSSRLLKRALDLMLASVALVVAMPVVVAIAAWIKLDSPGPVFFRQRRLGQGMREFGVFKFRTMKADTDDAAHRDYVRATMSTSAEVGANGLYKLDRSEAVTPSGRWLRKTSIDELPQLINVIRGEMSLVGPRPCLAYETELFQPYHFERFLVPAGITGMWQVTARASSTFREALDMDVLYARGWSMALDLRLLLRTPFQVIRQRKATT